METELQLLRARKEGFTILWKGRFLHSRYDPLREAYQQISELKIETEEQLVIFFGAGLGYTLRQFCRNYPNTSLWFEPNDTIARLAIEQSQLKPLLESGRLRHIARESEIEDEEGILWEIFRGRRNSDVLFVIHRASYFMDDRYSRFQKKIEDFLNRRDVNFATLSRFDRIWARNLLSNFSLLARARPVRQIFGSAKGKAAIICAAGPSLRESLPDLLSLRHRAVLIAVDSALQILSAAGIDPDLVVSVDPQPLNRRYLEGYRGKACFVFDPAASYLSLRLLSPQRLFYTWSPFPLAQLFFESINSNTNNAPDDNCSDTTKEAANSILDDSSKETANSDPGRIAFGGSVSTNAYDLAVQMGCDPILLVGQDLSFSYGLAHAKGAVLEEQLNFSESRLFRRELHNWRQLSALPPHHLPGQNGKQVASNGKLGIFYRWFDRRFAVDRDKGIRIINATAAGAFFPGIEHSALKAFCNLPKLADSNMERFPPLTQDSPSNSSSPDSSADRHSSQVDRFSRRLETLLEEFSDYEILLKEALQLALAVEKQAAKKSRVAQYGQLLERMNAIDEKLIKHRQLSSLAGSIMQRTILQISEGFKKEDDALERENRALAVARRSLKLYRTLLESVQFYNYWLKRSLKLCQ